MAKYKVYVSECFAFELESEHDIDSDALYDLAMDEANRRKGHEDGMIVMDEIIDTGKEEYCCLCGKRIEFYGNNPWPLADEGVCCEECNVKVIDERLRRLRAKE